MISFQFSAGTNKLPHNAEPCVGLFFAINSNIHGIHAPRLLPNNLIHRSFRDTVTVLASLQTERLHLMSIASCFVALMPRLSALRLLDFVVGTNSMSSSPNPALQFASLVIGYPGSYV